MHQPPTDMWAEVPQSGRLKQPRGMQWPRCHFDGGVRKDLFACRTSEQADRVMQREFQKSRKQVQAWDACPLVCLGSAGRFSGWRQVTDGRQQKLVVGMGMCAGEGGTGWCRVLCFIPCVIGYNSQNTASNATTPILQRLLSQSMQPK